MTKKRRRGSRNENRRLIVGKQYPKLFVLAIPTLAIIATSLSVEAWAPPPIKFPLGSAALKLARRSTEISENPTSRGTNAWIRPSRFENFEASLFESEDEEDEDGLLDDEDLRHAMDSLQKLQHAAGPNVLSTREQLLVDKSETADAFLENFGGADSSNVEKIAMGSIPEQLPQAPLGAFLDKNRQNKQVKSRNGDRYSVHRVSVEQEVQLGRLIQAGARVFQLKNKLEIKLGREPTKQEWAEAAGLASTKELRRTIAAYRTAKHKLVTANIGLVHSVVQKSRRRGSSEEEMIQEGSLGLLRAAELFDPSKGIRFSTYAVIWIKGFLSNSHVPELVHIPTKARMKWNKIQQAAAALKGQNLSDNTPTGEAIASFTGIPLREVLELQKRMLQSQYLVSLDAPITVQTRSGVETAEVETQYACNAIYDDDGLAEHAQLKAALISTLTTALTPREARFMRLRYGLTDGKGRTLHECADAMGISHVRVHHLGKACLAKLRKAADAQALDEYLLTIS